MPVLLRAFLLAILRLSAFVECLDARRWAYEIVKPTRSDSISVENTLQVVELAPARSLDDSLPDTAHVCLSIKSTGKDEAWLPTCFSVEDPRWVRNVVSIEPHESMGTDLEATGYSKGPEGTVGSITWQAKARIGPYSSRSSATGVIDQTNEIAMIEQQINQFRETYSADKYFDSRRLFRIISPKHGFTYPVDTSRIEIETQISNIESFTKLVGKNGTVCTYLTHTDTGEKRKACFPVKDNTILSSSIGVDSPTVDVAYAWSIDYADIGRRRGDFIFAISGFDSTGRKIGGEVRSRFTVQAQVKD